jgi:(p)ppGpp synthase/HD superfamily hydrolase
MLAMHGEPKMIVAVLHDVVEDSEWTIEQLRKEGFPEEILQSLDSVTRKEEETYDQFIARVEQDPQAREVKIADLEDNLKIGRLSLLTEQDFERLKKYQEALKRLQGEILYEQPMVRGGDTQGSR